MKPEKEITDLLIKFLNRSADEKEKMAVKTWLGSNPENRKYYEEMKKVFRLADIRKKVSTDKNIAWERIRETYYEKLNTFHNNRRIRLLRGLSLSAAASVLLAFAIGAFLSLYIRESKSRDRMSEITVPLGAQSQVILPDGSKVWLNAGSRILYPADFQGRTREVFLEGEAFFEVEKDQKRQFIVKTSLVDIRVYGTKFNVKSYPQEELVQTTLVEGSIALETHSAQGKMKFTYLKPNQTARIYKSSLEVSDLNLNSVGNRKIQPPRINRIEIEENKDPRPLTSWKDSKWIIESEKLGDLALQLERRYDVKIRFEDENLKAYRFSGTLSNETFEQVVRIIQISAPILFMVHGNEVLFKYDRKYGEKYDKMIETP